MQDASAGASPPSAHISCVFSPPRPPISPSRTGSEPNLLVRACNQLGQFLQHRETNLRYLALESMCTLASSEFSHEAVKTHIDTVINALKVRPLGACPGHTDLTCGSSAPSERVWDPAALGDQPRSEGSLERALSALLLQTERDVSVRQRAADLLYAMCDRSNAKQIVSEMLRYLETADYAIREEIVSPGRGRAPRLRGLREEGPPSRWGHAEPRCGKSTPQFPCLGHTCTPDLPSGW